MPPTAAGAVRSRATVVREARRPVGRRTARSARRRQPPRPPTPKIFFAKRLTTSAPRLALFSSASLLPPLPPCDGPDSTPQPRTLSAAPFAQPEEGSPRAPATTQPAAARPQRCEREARPRRDRAAVEDRAGDLDVSHCSSAPRPHARAARASRRAVDVVVRVGDDVVREALAHQLEREAPHGAPNSPTSEPAVIDTSAPERTSEASICGSRWKGAQRSGWASSTRCPCACSPATIPSRPTATGSPAAPQAATARRRGEGARAPRALAPPRASAPPPRPGAPSRGTRSDLSSPLSSATIVAIVPARFS